MTVKYQNILDATNALRDLKAKYLCEHGWTRSSNYPGCPWLWSRDFFDVDLERLEWNKEHGAGKPGGPTPAVAYGSLSGVSLDDAVRMTAQSLEREED